MADRFERLFALPNNLYSAGSPVIVAAGALLKDTQTGNIIVQLKYQSVSPLIIKALKVSISAYDVAGKEINGVTEYQYLDLNISNGQAFGSNKAIVLSNKVTRSFSISSITVVLSDGTAHEVSQPLSPLPEPTSLRSALHNPELIKQYQIAVNDHAKYVPQAAHGIWECTCGAWNSGKICQCCGATQNNVVDALNIPVLTENTNSRLAAEKAQREEKERLAEEARQEEAKQLALQEKQRRAAAKKTKTILAIALPILALVLVFALWIYPDVIKPSIIYNEAVELLSNKQFDDATTTFESLGNYKDAANMALESQYQKAEALLSEQRYGEAAQVFGNIVGYKDAETKITEIYNIVCSSVYEQGESLLQAGDKCGAAFAFGQLEDYEDAKDRAKALWAEIVSDCTLAVGFEHTVAIKENGEVVAVGNNEENQCDVDDWTNIVSISAGWDHTVGLRSDGTVVATGSRNESVQDWKNIVSVAAGGYHTVGLKSDGTVVAVGGNSYGQCNVEDWANIIAISAGQRHTVGLCADGTVVATGHNENGQCYVGSWEDIVSISATMYRTVGVKSDGTVIAAGDNDHSQSSLFDWENIVSVASARAVTFGLKEDGTVVARGYNYKGVCEVDEWNNIIAISTNGDLVVGLRRDGSLVAKGSGRYGGWSDVRTTEKALSLTEEAPTVEVSGLVFDEDGSIKYYREVDRDDDTYYKMKLAIYKDGTMDLGYTVYSKTSNFEGGRITSWSACHGKPVTWDENTQSFTLVDSDGKAVCVVTISAGGATVDINDRENWLVFEGQYELRGD